MAKKDADVGSRTDQGEANCELCLPQDEANLQIEADFDRGQMHSNLAVRMVLVSSPKESVVESAHTT